MFFVLQKISNFIARIEVLAIQALTLGVGLAVLAASAWRFLLGFAAGVGIVWFVWTAVDGVAAVLAAIGLALFAALFWMAGSFRL